MVFNRIRFVFVFRDKWKLDILKFGSVFVLAVLFLALTEGCSGAFQITSVLIFLLRFWEQKIFDFGIQERNLRLDIEMDILNK